MLSIDSKKDSVNSILGVQVRNASNALTVDSCTIEGIKQVNDDSDDSLERAFNGNDI